jgi:hypothetical protein
MPSESPQGAGSGGEGAGLSGPMEGVEVFDAVHGVNVWLQTHEPSEDFIASNNQNAGTNTR